MARRRKAKIVEPIRIVDIADRGMAFGRDEDEQVYLTSGVVPGDVIRGVYKRKKKGIPFVFVEEVLEYSDERVTPLCSHFGECGGCKWQNLKYDSQLKYKGDAVDKTMVKIGKSNDHQALPIKGSDNPFYYRNKMDYSFSAQRWITQEEVDSDLKIEQSKALGFHRPGSFNKVIDIQKCHLQDVQANEMRNWLREYTSSESFPYYHFSEHKGFLRNLIIRNSTLGHWMVIIAFAENKKDVIIKLLDDFLAAFPNISTLYYVVNTKMNDTLYDQNHIHHFGEPEMEEKIGHVKYKIGPKSFFQTNPKQAKILFDTVSEFAELDGNELLYDLYCGLGTIGLYLADQCKKVVGIEAVESAIDDAKINQAINEIKNTEFYAGDVKDLLTDDFINRFGKADIVISDPPRAGMHPDVVATLLKMETPKIVYISCNPPTQARDIQLLSEKYDLIKTQPVDMFPQTSHIENVALLKLKS